MSELRSAVDEVGSRDWSHLADEALEDELAELQYAAKMIEVARLRLLAQVDRRRPFDRDGHLSTSSWFAHRFGESHAAAAGDVRMARALETMPQTREALAADEISRSAARALVAAKEAEPDGFADAETFLLDAARRHGIRDLHRVVAYWRNVVQAHREADTGDEALRERRRLFVSPTVFGMVRIDGDFDPETGETILAALRAFLDAEARSGDAEDRRTPSQRRADALGEICRQSLDRSDRPEAGGERPHITVTVDIEALRGDAGSRCEFDHTGPVHPAIARRLACDCGIVRVVMKGRSEPLDVGRQTEVVPAAMRPPWCSGTGTADSPAVIAPTPGATRIMSGTGPTVGPPRSRTSSCCAGVTTEWFTTATDSGYG